MGASPTVASSCSMFSMGAVSRQLAACKKEVTSETKCLWPYDRHLWPHDPHALHYNAIHPVG